MRWTSMSEALRMPAPPVLNFSDLDPSWNWLARHFQQAGDGRWLHCSTQALGLPARLPRRDSLGRLLGAWQACRTAAAQGGVLVSHGPRPALYSGLLAPQLCPRVRHLVYAFNFTELPSGPQRALMARAYRRPERLITFSTHECDLYAEAFGIPRERLQMIPWAANPLPEPAGGPPPMAGDYLCAIGGQGRDYATLAAAMRSLPDRRLIIVGNPDSLRGLDLPSNVQARSAIPLAEVATILHHARCMALPLRGGEVPCGHVTIVSAMHAGKAIVATDSLGVHDYLRHEDNAPLCRPGHAGDLAAAIERLMREPDTCTRLGEAGRDFATRYCSESHAVACFQQFLDTPPG